MMATMTHGVLALGSLNKSGSWLCDSKEVTLPDLKMPGWDGCYGSEDVSHELGENSNFTSKFRITINGHQVDIYVDAEGNKMEWDPVKGELRYIGATNEQIAIARGIAQGLNDIKRRGGDLKTMAEYSIQISRIIRTKMEV